MGEYAPMIAAAAVGLLLWSLLRKVIKLAILAAVVIVLALMWPAISDALGV
ncbi:MAG: hypothetical protein M3P91_04815 [Actinomycetota bacterium]|nr:hypothetical protein [Actinomycetota bacterium]